MVSNGKNQENTLIKPMGMLSNDRFVGTINPDMIKVLRENNLLSNPLLIDLADSINKYDNPSLAVFTVKFAD